MRQAIIAAALAGVTGAAIVARPAPAEAQTQTLLAPDGKGIAGCALLGAETVALIEAAAGVRQRWAYAVFPLIGAVAGGLGGYFLEQSAGDPPDQTITGISVGTLVLGLGLVIPTTIAFVSATSYRPESDTTEDNAPAAEPLDESTTPGGATPATTPAGSGGATSDPAGGAGGGGGTAPTSPPAGAGTGGGTSRRSTSRPLAQHRPMLPPSLLNLDLGAGGVNVGIPAVSVANSYSWAEVRQYGLAPQSELRIPILSGTF